jgi:protein arginine kinase activator
VLCDKCKKNPASVLIKQNINGHLAQFNFCEGCAAGAAAFAAGNMSFDTILKNLMNSLMGFSDDFHQMEKESHGLSCSLCALTYEGFKSTGKVGCAECYNAFRNQLITLFKNVHGSANHAGKLPVMGGAQLIKVREVEKLKDRLKKLIDDEEFEEAAKIRDRIKELTV